MPEAPSPAPVAALPAPVGPFGLSAMVDAQARHRAIRRFICIQLVLLFLLQKFAVQVGGGWLELPLPLFYAGLALLVRRGDLAISLPRLVTFTLFLIALLISLLLGGRGFASGALALLLMLYVPMLFIGAVPSSGTDEVYRFFIGITVMLAGLVLAEQAVNFTIGHAYWPSLDALVPASFLFPNFNYLQPMYFGSPLIKPNAIFFLEVSFVSQILALGIVAEIVSFRRPLVLAFLAGTLMLTFAGTGLLLLALMLPFLLARADGRLILAAVFVAAVGAVMLMTTSWADVIVGRLGEFGSANSSGYQRYVAPLATTARALGDPAFLLTGLGPGNVPMLNQNPLPVTKLVLEYGVLTAIAFYLMFCVALFGGAHSKIMAVALFLFFNLGGGSLSVPLVVLLCVLLGTLTPRTADRDGLPGLRRRQGADVSVGGEYGW